MYIVQYVRIYWTPSIFSSKFAVKHAPSNDSYGNVHAALYAVAAANFTEKRVEKAYTNHRVQIWFNSKTHGGCIALAHCTDSTEFFFFFIKTFECGGSLYCTLRRITCKFYSKTCGESMLPLPKTHSTDFTVKTVKGLALHLHTARILVDILYAGKHMDGACIAHCTDTHATLCTVTHVLHTA